MGDLERLYWYVVFGPRYPDSIQLLYSDYSLTHHIAKKGALPPLNDAQTKKLKLLSLISLATSHTALTYPSLQSSLEIPTSRALESLVTDAIYAGLVTGTMDPRNQLVSIISVAPLRDLAPGSVPQYQKALADWSQRCEDTIRELEAQAEKIKDETRVREEKRKVREAQIEEKLEKAGGKKEEDGDEMDVDEEGGLKGLRKGLRAGKNAIGLGRR